MDTERRRRQEEWGRAGRGRTRDEVRPPILQAAEVTGVTEMGARMSFTVFRSTVALLRYSTTTSLSENKGEKRGARQPTGSVLFTLRSAQADDTRCDKAGGTRARRPRVSASAIGVSGGGEKAAPPAPSRRPLQHLGRLEDGLAADVLAVQADDLVQGADARAGGGA